MKQTTLKHIHTLAAHAHLDLDDLFKWGLNEQRHWGHGFDQAIWSYTERWEYWWSGVTKDAMRYYGDDCRQYLIDKGLDTSPIDDDLDTRTTFEADVTRAYCDALKSAEESRFYKLVTDDVEDRIAKVGAPYFCYLKLEGNKFVETPHLYEAERVMFGFTRKWHEDTVLGTTYYGGYKASYDPDEIDNWADGAIEDVKRTIDIDYRMQEGTSTKEVLEFFGDYNETEHLLVQNEQHWAWVTRTTTRMMTSN